MSDFNHVTMTGNLCADPELRYTQGGSAVAFFAIAVNRTIQDGKQETLFIDVSVWGKMAETVSRYLSKGAHVLVDGYLRQENWQTKQGENRKTIKLVATTIQFLDKPPKNDAERPQRQQQTPPQTQNAHKYSRADIPESMQRPTNAPTAPTNQQNEFHDDIPF